VRDEGGAWPSWAQAEGVVGFTDAFAATRDPAYAAAALRIWDAIEQRFADRRNGEWFKQLDAAMRPDPSVPKAGHWSCPYHGVRACLEVMDRVARLADDAIP
jgi:mannobiose 2-epimerase